jgi:pimeloyl-ACP methyl ester carboxylesterase
MKVYFIPGIGADYRLFTHIRLPDGYEPSHIHWTTPHKNEKLSEYAFRLTSQIDTTQPFILIGMSLGGIMSVEIAKRINPLCTIIVSSIPVSSHMPVYFRLAGKLRLGKLLPASFMKMAASIKHILTMRPAANRRLMLDIIRAGDKYFIRWALNAVLEWKNEDLPQPLYHIHGTRDEVFPISLTTPTHIVKKGDHNFLLSRPETLNHMLEEIILAQPLPQQQT